MPNKFTLIGLPGVGKTTVSVECARRLQLNGYSCEFMSTDTIIRDRFKADDPVILEFQKVKNIVIPTEIFTSKSPTGDFMAIFGEEPLFRDLEELFIKDIISSNKALWFDLGGKAPLRDGVKKTLIENKTIPIFLYADHAKIISQLSYDNNWMKRSNYKNAGDPGWKELALTHRQDRLMKYINAASIIIEVYGQTPAELAQEIFCRIAEFKSVCLTRDNCFMRQFHTFFPSEEISHDQRDDGIDVTQDFQSCV